VKRLGIYFVFIVVFLVLGYSIYESYGEVNGIQKEFDKLSVEKASILEDNKRLEEDIKYFSIPHNLEKELRARFNVRRPDEKLIIIVPPKAE